jgi:vacuolar-type H+-ATPase subunit H
MVSDARQRALEIVRTAHADAERLAKEHTDKVLAEVEGDIADVAANGIVEVEALKQELATRQSDAADFVVKLVTTI